MKHSSTWLRWIGTAASMRARPASVSTANEPRRSDGQVSLATSPAASKRSTTRLKPLRVRVTCAVRSLIRSRPSGEPDPITRTVDGVELPTSGTYALDVSHSSVNFLGFSAKGEVNRDDFVLTWNQTLETGGLLVGKKATIEIEAEAAPAG